MRICSRIARDFIADPALQAEVFGAASLVVQCADDEEIRQVFEHLEGQLTITLQPKLLRFIQDKEYERVGDPVTRRADVRILAATNLNLEDMVRDGRFREDLLYRLNVITLHLPPLRERSEDILTLADHRRNRSR